MQLKDKLKLGFKSTSTSRMHFAPLLLAISFLQGTALVLAAPSPVPLDDGQPMFAQCGGIGWTGPTKCASGLYCNKINDYYSACFPNNVPVTTRY
ncbi:hypothetical protein CVT24_009138 [Panaeolus cyanescens]|uniref:CBM1 domain-containing protein n=1 Tax=Panaeolus cyanescens TaxID=181874 RepID=A0A409W3U7_9AGAR|nr:hypothetical protein CVT24_009138 [Panaeolus cyanescens]